MTWTVGIIEDGPHGSVVQDDGRVVNTYKRKIWAKTDASAPTPADLVAAIGIDPGSPFEYDANATCRGATNMKRLRTRAPHIAFTVDYEWATNAPLPDDITTDPTLRRVLWEIHPRIETTYINKDRNKKLIVNAAGQPFDGGVPVAVRYGVATARRNADATGYDKAAVMADSGKLNDDTYLGGAAGTVQVDRDAVEKYEGSYHYWEETFTFNYNPLGWQPQPANVGFYQRVAGLTKVIPITIGAISDPPTADATKVQEPEPLYDAASEVADPTHVEGTVVPASDRPDGCPFIDVDYYEEMDMDTFGL